jgi:hypothetical protein
MTTKIILVIVAITTAAMLSMVAGQVSTQVVYGAEQCTTLANDSGGSQILCVEQGKDPNVSIERCDADSGCFTEERAVTHREGAEIKTSEQQLCKKEIRDGQMEGITCSTKQ